MQVITSGVAGGAQSHLHALCHALAGRVELGVAIGSQDGRSALGDRLAPLGVATFHLRGLRNSTNPLRLRGAVRELRVLIEQWQPDVVHAHSSFAGAAARIAAHRCGIPAVYTVHGFGFKREAQPFVREVAWIGESLLAPWADHMICVSNHEATLARRLPRAPKAVSVIPNGLPDVAWRADAGVQPPAVAMVARVAAPKRADLLLDALALLPECPETHILGDGPQRASLQAKADALGLAAVTFAGDVNDVPQRLAQHGIFVLLSDHEGMPISVIEAMRAGLAIVASRLPGIEEMVDHERSALLVRNDPPEVRDALARLLADPALRTRLAQAARARFERDFDASAMADKVLAIYGDVTRARAGARTRA
jgi:glycosyltransferase involved in cell wall biosynthesis